MMLYVVAIAIHVVVAVLAIGVVGAVPLVALRKGFAPGGGREVALANVERWGWTMCAAVAVITLLMQMKPLP